MTITVSNETLNMFKIFYNINTQLAHLDKKNS